MKNRTRILVTHHVQMCIQKSSFILLLDNGQVTLSGDPAALLQTNALNSLIDEKHQMKDSNEINNMYIDAKKESRHFDAKKKSNNNDNYNNGTLHVLVKKECK